ncbi:MAG: ABC transporter substrate-binding protein, partial [Desulfovibrio sp.]|nr:ABC transporter substrate-binding protein [Desulfovibrio sp.]
LTKLKSSDPDLIFYTGYYPETGMLLRQKKEMGWDVPMMGGDAANHQDLVKIAGTGAANGYFFVSPPLPQDMDSPEAKSFLSSFKEKYDALPLSIWAVMAGDAYLALESALAAGNDDPEKISAWLKKQESIPSLSGPVGFDEKGDRVGDFYRVYTVNDQGQFILRPKS